MNLNMVMVLLGAMFVLGVISFSLKPSPIYGGVGLVLSGGVGCAIVLNFGGSFLGLVLFLIYLGGMLVVFGYTTAMASDKYPEGWGSNIIAWGLLLGGLFEGMMFFWMTGQDQFEIFLTFNSMGEWVLYDDESGVGMLDGGTMGAAAIYSYNYWLMVVSGWSLLVGIFIVIEITRGD